MRKIKIYFLLLISTFSCNEQSGNQNNKDTNKNQIMNNKNLAPYNIQDIGDGTKINYDSLSPNIIVNGEKELKKRRFFFPTKNEYIEKINTIFSVNLSNYQNKIVVLRPSMFPEIAIKELNFILLQDESGNELTHINGDLLFHFNNYIFYRNTLSYNWLKINAKENLADLVIYFKFNEDKNLVKYILEKYDFNSLNKVQDLIFFEHQNKKLLSKKILQDIELFKFGGKSTDYSIVKEGDAYINFYDIVEDINQNPEKYESPFEAIAILLNQELRVGITGDTDAFLIENKNFLTHLKANDFFHLSTIKSYLTSEKAPDKNEAPIYSIIDPDGFTNLRKEKNTHSDIIGKIKSGETVDVLNNSSDWYLVKTLDGKKGYVHKSRIKVN